MILKDITLFEFEYSNEIQKMYLLNIEPNKVGDTINDDKIIIILANEKCIYLI